MFAEMILKIKPQVTVKKTFQANKTRCKKESVQGRVAANETVQTKKSAISPSSQIRF